jgi:hypothetical protein
VAAADHDQRGAGIFVRGDLAAGRQLRQHQLGDLAIQPLLQSGGEDGHCRRQLLWKMACAQDDERLSGTPVIVEAS